jgi:predicted transcriptional regulator
MARRQVRQLQLASHLGLSQTAVSNRLAGTVPFDINELTATAQLLQVSIADLIPAVVGVAA